MKYIDPIHGQIYLPNIIGAIIKTRQFQRLKLIKQLGALYLSLENANHSRFEHCIGTYYCSILMMTSLIENTKKLQIPKFYQLCVNIAGLLHDIGHGPFSHMWECINPTSHEENSFAAIDDIFKTIEYRLDDRIEMHNYGIQLIKALIKGDKKLLREPINKELEFLFEIISNKQCDIDVDKWDYLQRDAHYLSKYYPKKFQINLAFKEIFTSARVSDNRAHIEYKYDSFENIYNLFDARTKFHINFYQLPKTRLYEEMICKAVKLCDNRNYNLEELNGKKLSEITSKDSEEFLKLTDENVLTFLNKINDKDIVALLKPLYEKNILIEIDREEFKNEKNFKKIERKIELAGQKMKVENILFYGDPSEMPKIQIQRGFYENVHYFKIID